MPPIEPVLLVGPTVLCVVDGCEWFHAPTPQVAPDASALDAVMGVPAGTINATQRQRFLEDVERELEQHLRSHSWLEWFTTVTRLKSAAGEIMVVQ